MKIGIIGAGQIGGTLTRRLTALGHKVSKNWKKKVRPGPWGEGTRPGRWRCSVRGEGTEKPKP
jgi:hypothetical protein